MPDTFPDLFWGYTAIWIILALYIWSLGYRLSKLERAAKQRGLVTDERATTSQD